LMSNGVEDKQNGEPEKPSVGKEFKEKLKEEIRSVRVNPKTVAELLEKGEEIAKTVAEPPLPKLARQNIHDALQGLCWLLEKILQSTTRFIHYKARELRLRGVDVICSTRLEPIDMGMRLTIDLTLTEDTVIFFALKSWQLEKILKRKIRSISEVARKKVVAGRGV